MADDNEPSELGEAEGGAAAAANVALANRRHRAGLPETHDTMNLLNMTRVGRGVVPRMANTRYDPGSVSKSLPRLAKPSARAQ